MSAPKVDRLAADIEQLCADLVKSGYVPDAEAAAAAIADGLRAETPPLRVFRDGSEAAPWPTGDAS